MRIGRTIPPAAAPISWSDVAWAIGGMFNPARSLHAREEELRCYFGIPHVSLVSSGAAALTLVLRGLRSLSNRMRVVVPAYTCFSVPAAILKAGLQPVICDINPTNFDFDHALLEQTLDDDTLCVVAHHLFGIPSDIEGIRALCQPRGIFVVEDAAQAMGIAGHGGKLGTLGDVGIFSLGRGKQITCGTGGIIVTASDRVANSIESECRALKSPSTFKVLKELARLVLMAIFIRPTLYSIPAALPFLRLGTTIFPKDIPLERLSGMHAGFLRKWETRLRESNRARTEAVAYLSQRLSLTLAQGPSHPYLRLPIVAKTSQERERILSASRQRGLGLSFGYPTPINEISEISWLFRGQRFEAARRVADSILALPTHHWLSDRDKRAIAECVGTPVDLVCDTRPLRKIPERLTRIFRGDSGGLPHDSAIRWWHIRRTVRAATAAVPSRHVFAMFRWFLRHTKSEGARKGAKPC